MYKANYMKKSLSNFEKIYKIPNQSLYNDLRYNSKDLDTVNLNTQENN